MSEPEYTYTEAEKIRLWMTEAGATEEEIQEALLQLDTDEDDTQ
jgi:hypothetical protein